MKNQRNLKFKKLLKIACLRNDIDSTSKLIDKLNMKQSTFYYKLNHCSFTVNELARIFKIANFTGDEITEVFK